MKKTIILLCMVVLGMAVFAAPAENPFIGEWHGSVEGYDFIILLMHSNMCIITVTTIYDDSELTEEAEGTWSYDNNIIRVNAAFRNSKIPGINRLSWISTYNFLSNDNTTFSILITPPGGGRQTRVIFSRVFS
jgi:hypothetical protein